MFRTTGRIWDPRLCLAVLFLSVAGCATVYCPNETPATQTIVVYDDGKVSKDCAAISKGAQQTITWSPSNPRTKVMIQLIVPKGKSVPFDGLSCSPFPNGDQGCWLKTTTNGEPLTDGYSSTPITQSEYFAYYAYATPPDGKRAQGPLVGIRIDP
jgi:hypothetical protein